MKVLMHVCCGPCSLYPLDVLRREGIEVSGLFYNPNIHPYREFKRRIDGLTTIGEKKRFKVYIDDEYGLTEYLRKVVHHEKDKCEICYDMRLEKTAETAAGQGANAFTTTLLYSKYQNHEMLKVKCEELADRYQVKFLYRDFRKGWQEGIDESRELDIYRQPYCGCIYSEQERYDKKFRKQKNKERK
jgi:hypothetical protein